MKALTLKKSAVAVAMIAAAGAANANTLKAYNGPGVLDVLVVAGTSGAVTATAATAMTSLTAASELATDKAAQLIAADTSTPGVMGDNGGSPNTVKQSDGSNLLLAYKATSYAPRNGNLIKFVFTNGGLAGNSNNYKLTSAGEITAAAVEAAAVDAAVATFDDLSANVIAKEESNGVISSITFSLGEDTTVGETIFLVGAGSTTDATVVDVEVDDTIASLDYSGTVISPELLLTKGAASGATVTVDMQVLDSANGTEITTAAVAPVTLATAKSAVKITGFASNPDVIDYAKDALQLVDGKTANTDTDFLVAANSAVTTSAGLGFEAAHVAKASFTVKADNCAAVNTGDNSKAADDVIIGSTGLTASTTQTCTWTSGLIDVKTAAANLAVKLDGTTTLKNASWTYEGKVTLANGAFTALTDAAVYAKEYKTVTGTAFTFTSDVQGDAFEIPYIYHIGSGEGYSSFVKLVNKTAKSTAANANNTVEVAFDAIITNTITKEEMTVSNYKLGAIMNEGQFSFSGSDVIKALNTPMGKATDGYNETALTLDEKENFHIALRLIPRNVSNNVNFYVDVQNTAPVGRAQGTAERK
jgi:hypothetical protein